MCLIAFAWAPGTPRPLVLASNRDEFWQRPTQALDTWVLPGGQRVYGGRDLEAGGTWVGFADNGHVAMVTNVRRWPPEGAPRSRGDLATSWLGQTPGPQGWRGWLAQHPAEAYGGVNLVLGQLEPVAPRGPQAQGPCTASPWLWLTNREPETQAGAAAMGQGWWGRVLQPGVYGLSNAALDTPWPKTVALKQALARALVDGPLELGPGPADAPCTHHPLLAALLNAEQVTDLALPQTGVPPDLERCLSAAFVHDTTRSYGTRSSLVAVVDNTGLHLHEWTHHVARHPLQGTAWPLSQSVYKGLSMSTWGMPTSS